MSSRIYVHPDFKTALKERAAREGCSLLHLTEQIAGEMHGPERRRDAKKAFNFKIL